jgi:hypothetical protein
MFQYAAGYAVAAHRGDRLLCDLHWYAEQDKRAFQLDRLNVPIEQVTPEQVATIFPFGRRKTLARRVRNASCHILGPIAGKRPLTGTRFTQTGLHYDPAVFDLKGPAYLQGHFQSWRFFHGHDADLRKRYRPAARLSDNASRWIAAIAAERQPVAVHIRRGDYAAEANAYHGVLATAYYRKAIAIVEALMGDQAALFVFSDDVGSVESVLGNDQKVSIVSGNDERSWEDIYLMSSCRHFIIANSSFSWWGAWLSDQSEKIVIAPRAWLQPEVMRKLNTADLIPPGWITI